MERILKGQGYALLLLGTLVIVLGIPAVLSLIDHPKSQYEDAANRTSAAHNNRLPASIDESGSAAGPMTGALSKVASPTVMIGEVSCPPNEEAKIDLGKTEGSQVRLKVDACEGTNPTKVVNKENGYIGEAISAGVGQFTTDYIDLKEGINVIEISRLDQEGKTTTQQVRVERLPARIPDEEADESAKN